MIESQEGFAASPIFMYEGDYSQYVPRGHIMHGRMSMLLKGELIKPEDPAKDARIQIIQASLIASELQKNPELLENWGRI